MANLTPKQEKFCMVYIETGNASEAYRQAYSCKTMKPENVAKRASELLARGDITGMLEKLREPIKKRHAITVDSLLEELEEARQLAIQTAKAAAMATATMGKARLLGLDKQIVENTHKVVDSGKAEW